MSALISYHGDAAVGGAEVRVAEDQAQRDDLLRLIRAEEVTA